MQLSHTLSATTVEFDDPNLVSSAGLIPVLELARRCGLNETAETVLSVPSPNPALKVATVVAGMVAGADSIDDLDRLRHGGMGRLFTGIRAPSTVGTFLRSFTFGHVKQLDKLAGNVLVNLTGHTPLLSDVDQVCFVDVDDTVKRTYGYAKQGAGYGYSGVKGLNALIATVSTPTSAPVIAGTRLRKGSTSSARGAASFVASTLKVAKRCGATGLVVARMDSAFYTADVVAAIGRARARFSITARLNPSVKAAISKIDDQAWTPIRYPNAIWDPQANAWISDAEVAETSYTAFTSRTGKAVTARLIVRRVKMLAPAGNAQPALVEGHRYHAVFTNTTLTMLQAETSHRGHAIVEQVIADLKAGPLAHLPSGKFAANAAWLHPDRDHAQPHPRRPVSRVGVPCQCSTRHDPRPPDQHSGPDLDLCPTGHHASTDRLALGTPLAIRPHRDHLTQPTTPTGNNLRNPQWKNRTDRQPRHAHHRSRANQDQLHGPRNRAGGSRLRLRPRTPSGR